MPNALVNWPAADAVRDTGEDGMSVIAYWPSGDYSGFTVDLSDVITYGHPADEVEQVFPYYMRTYESGTMLKAARRSSYLTATALLGNTRTAMWDTGADRYWQATRDDLTDAGRALLDQLDTAYGRPAILITHLST